MPSAWYNRPAGGSPSPAGHLRPSCCATLPSRPCCRRPSSTSCSTLPAIWGPRPRLSIAPSGPIARAWPEMLPSYRVDGPDGAPLLVLANSLGTTSAMWEPQLPVLSGRFRVVRYEHRGHGGTPAPPGPYTIEQLGGDVLDLLDAVGAERASLCGLSLGGMVAMWLAAHVPERVERLVLCGTAPQLPPADQWAARAATIRDSAPLAQ